MRWDGVFCSNKILSLDGWHKAPGEGKFNPCGLRRKKRDVILSVQPIISRKTNPKSWTNKILYELLLTVYKQCRYLRQRAREKWGFFELAKSKFQHPWLTSMLITSFEVWRQPHLLPGYVILRGRCLDKCQYSCISEIMFLFSPTRYCQCIDRYKVIYISRVYGVQDIISEHRVYPWTKDRLQLGQY